MACWRGCASAHIGAHWLVRARVGIRRRARSAVDAWRRRIRHFSKESGIAAAWYGTFHSSGMGICGARSVGTRSMAMSSRHCRVLCPGGTGLRYHCFSGHYSRCGSRVFSLEPSSRPAATEHEVHVKMSKKLLEVPGIATRSKTLLG